MVRQGDVEGNRDALGSVRLPDLARQGTRWRRNRRRPSFSVSDHQGEVKYVASVLSTRSSLGLLWTTSDVSPEELTLVRLADCLRWNFWVRVSHTSLRVKRRISISLAKRETNVSPGSTTRGEENSDRKHNRVQRVDRGRPRARPCAAGTQFRLQRS